MSAEQTQPLRTESCDCARCNRSDAEQRAWLDGMRTFGLECGYPACCVEAFVRDVGEHRSPGRTRGLMYRRSGESYVPCWACVERWEIGGES